MSKGATHCKHCNIDLSTVPRNGATCRTCQNGMGRYGLHKLAQIELHESQNGKCKLCDKEVEMFIGNKANSGYIDHCHKTGKVRAILCHPCNTSIGYIENNLNIEKVTKYINS